jgi:hypothetical protein
MSASKYRSILCRTEMNTWVNEGTYSTRTYVMGLTAEFSKGRYSSKPYRNKWTLIKKYVEGRGRGLIWSRVAESDYINQGNGFPSRDLKISEGCIHAPPHSTFVQCDWSDLWVWVFVGGKVDGWIWLKGCSGSRPESLAWRTDIGNQNDALTYEVLM